MLKLCYFKVIERSISYYAILICFLKNAKTGALKTLGDSLRINPENLLLPGDTQKWLDTGKFAYVEVCRVLKLLIARGPEGTEVQL